VGGASGDTRTALKQFNNFVRKIFMTTVKGLYEHGQVILLEKAPVEDSKKVLITFIEDDENDILRSISLTSSTKEFKQYLADSNEDLYQEYLKK
jgi:hypothetical protein